VSPNIHEGFNVKRTNLDAVQELFFPEGQWKNFYKKKLCRDRGENLTVGTE